MQASNSNAGRPTLTAAEIVDGMDFLAWVEGEAKAKGVSKSKVYALFGPGVENASSKIRQGRTRPPRNWREYVSIHPQQIKLF